MSGFRKIIDPPNVRQEPPPRKTMRAYKLFEVDENHPGKLFSKYILSNKAAVLDIWLDAEMGPLDGKGATVGKNGKKFATRPGFHCCAYPVATHIGEKDENSGKIAYRRPNEVWAEVEIGCDVDWQAEAENRAERTKNGKINRRTAHITDQVPINGKYDYKTNNKMVVDWYIAGCMRVARLLSDREVEEINASAGISDLPRVEPFDFEAYGFENPEKNSEYQGMRP